MKDWLTLREASAATGLSVRTLERRVHAGELQARKVLRGKRPQWEIWRESLTLVGDNRRQPPTEPPHALTTTADSDTLLGALAQLGHLHESHAQQIKKLQETVEAQTEAIRELREELAAARAEGRRSWWHRLRGRTS